MAEKRTFRALSVRKVQGEMRTAYAASRIAQLCATPQDAVMALGPQEPSRRGKAKPDQGLRPTNVPGHVPSKSSEVGARASGSRPDYNRPSCPPGRTEGALCASGVPGAQYVRPRQRHSRILVEWQIHGTSRGEISGWPNRRYSFWSSMLEPPRNWLRCRRSPPSALTTP